MAATARLSPSASLLRNSRLFALPPPLAPSSQEVSSAPEGRSDTSTLPYPTRAAIEAPMFAVNKGDWGLKRPLPLKSTMKSMTTGKTGAPIIRIQGGIDTREHIADFESARDHAHTLKKWQNLHMPISAPQVDTSGRETPSESVFDSSYDNTSNLPNITGHGRENTGVWPNVPPEFLSNVNPQGQPVRRTFTTPAPKRWRYDGPWLAGMSGMEFEAYLANQVRTRKAEFKEKVRAHMIAEKTSGQKAEAMEKGEGVGSASEPIEVTENELAEYMRTLRTKPETFGTLITDFLDLPEGPAFPKSAQFYESDRWHNGRSTVAARVYTDAGPPKTHPSAGLSYLKIGPKVYARNDPVYGPLALNQPIQARVLKTRRQATAVMGSLGVAGVVANTVETSGVRSNIFEAFSPKAGGHKRVVRPVSASVNSNGTVNLSVKMAASHQLGEDDSIVAQDGKQPPDASRARNPEYAAMPLLDGNYQNRRGTTQSRYQPSDNEQRLDDLKKVFDPFGKRAGSYAR